MKEKKDIKDLVSQFLKSKEDEIINYFLEAYLGNFNKDYVFYFPAIKNTELFNSIKEYIEGNEDFLLLKTPFGESITHIDYLKNGFRLLDNGILTTDFNFHFYLTWITETNTSEVGNLTCEKELKKLLRFIYEHSIRLEFSDRLPKNGKYMKLMRRLITEMGEEYMLYFGLLLEDEKIIKGEKSLEDKIKSLTNLLPSEKEKILKLLKEERNE